MRMRMQMWNVCGRGHLTCVVDVDVRTQQPMSEESPEGAVFRR